MKIFLTGNLGYVGTVLHQRLENNNHDVTGCDINYFPKNWNDDSSNIDKSLRKDIRDITKEDLIGFDAVCHLAGLSNDPMGEINQSLTNEINFLETVRIAKLSKEAGIQRFIFSSSCSTYGLNEDIVNENSEVVPQTAYAKSKVDSEIELLKLKDSTFAPIILRNATVYGISPNLRLDLVINNLVGSAVSTGKIKLLSDGTAWRPLLHVEDMADAFIKCIEAPIEQVTGETFNVGSNDDNVTVLQIAEKILKIIPNSEIEIAKNSNKDNRSYKVNFDKIYQKLGFKTKWNLDDGIKYIYEEMKNKNFSIDDFTNKKFFRLKYLIWLMEEKKINEKLELIK
jgi:nucleoside-diphosphate-sugar epimerase